MTRRRVMLERPVDRSEGAQAIASGETPIPCALGDGGGPPRRVGRPAHLGKAPASARAESATPAGLLPDGDGPQREIARPNLTTVRRSSYVRRCSAYPLNSCTVSAGVNSLDPLHGKTIALASTFVTGVRPNT